MAGEKEAVEVYMQTIERMEPDIHHVDASAFYASAAISLKRIADALEILVGDPNRPVNSYGEGLSEAIQNSIARGLRNISTGD